MAEWLHSGMAAMSMDMGMGMDMGTNMLRHLQAAKAVEAENSPFVTACLENSIIIYSIII